MANLLPLCLPHLCPVGLLLLGGAAVAQGDPAQPLPGPHAAPPAEHGHHQRHLGQLEERHLEDKRLLVGGVGLAAAHGRLAFGHLFALGVQHGQFNVGVWKERRAGDQGWSAIKWLKLGTATDILISVRKVLIKSIHPLGCFTIV